jgi:ferredoxin-NADP reductase
VTTSYDVEFLGKQMCGEDIVTCRIARPEGYSFAAGQWFRLTIPTAEGPEVHTFSHCSAPGDEVLEMTTRLSPSTYKVALAALEPGTAVRIAGPGGRLALPADAPRVCFLIGGVGITPVRSILRDVQQTGRTFDDALLLFGNRDEECVPFAEEFEAMAAIGVRTVICFERATESWAGERGFIGAQTVRRHLDPDDGRPFMVAGPPVMVGAMERVMDELGIDAPRRLVERFGAPTP